MEGEDIVLYQEKDSRLHRAWLQSNASANTGEGMGSEPGSGSLVARRARGDLSEFDQEFFLLLIILEATNHGEVVEHVGVKEIVDIEGKLEGD